MELTVPQRQEKKRWKESKGIRFVSVLSDGELKDTSSF